MRLSAWKSGKKVSVENVFTNNQFLAIIDVVIFADLRPVRSNLMFREMACMKKLELLARIQKLSSLVHSEDLLHYQLTEVSVKELHTALNKLTEEYIACYC